MCLLPIFNADDIYHFLNYAFTKIIQMIVFASERQQSDLQEMNVTFANVTSVGRDQESFSKALTKNFIVLVLGALINYVNMNLIYTFCKNQV